MCGLCGWSDRWSLLFLLVIFLEGLHLILLRPWNIEITCWFKSMNAYVLLCLGTSYWPFPCIAIILVPLGPSLQIIRGKCQGPIGGMPLYFLK